jgi:enoyl-CoA hydratase/carnithine racemase
MPWDRDWQFLQVERIERILTVRFIRQDSAVNPLSSALMTELTELAHMLEDDFELNAVILTGSPTVFSAGFDLNDGKSREKLGLAERRVRTKLGPKMCEAWEKIECLTIAAVEGWCIGGGFALAVSTDIRVAGQGAGFYVPEIERGMNMSWGSVPRSVALIGPSKTKRLFVLAEKIDAKTALDWGLVDEIVPDGSAYGAAMKLAQRAAEMPPVSVRMCKEGINAAAFAFAKAVSTMDRDQFLLAQTGGDYQEGVDSFFEKRPPKFTGD